MSRERDAERAVLVAVALGALLAPLNSTMIAVALPDIVDDFDSSIGTVGWLVTSYLLALAVVQPVAGKLGDRHGRRPFIVGGLVVFGIASLGAALAPSLPFLIGFRVAQAVSGAVEIATSASGPLASSGQSVFARPNAVRLRARRSFITRCIAISPRRKDRRCASRKRPRCRWPVVLHPLRA